MLSVMCNCHTQSQRIRLPHFSHRYSSSYTWKTVIRIDSFAYWQENSTVDVSATARDRGVTAVSHRGTTWLTQNWRQVLSVNFSVIWKRHTHAKPTGHAKRSKKTITVTHLTALFTLCSGLCKTPSANRQQSQWTYSGHMHMVSVQSLIRAYPSSLIHLTYMSLDCRRKDLSICPLSATSCHPSSKTRCYFDIHYQACSPQQFDKRLQHICAVTWTQHININSVAAGTAV